MGRVEDSLVAISMGGEFVQEFRTALEAAVRQWRFEPAEIHRILRKTNDSGRGSYWLLMSKRPIEDEFDVACTFTATGAVLAEVPK